MVGHLTYIMSRFGSGDCERTRCKTVFFFDARPRYSGQTVVIETFVDILHPLVGLSIIIELIIIIIINYY